LEASRKKCSIFFCFPFSDPAKKRREDNFDDVTEKKTEEAI
jgi:hypothetical protein